MKKIAVAGVGACLAAGVIAGPIVSADAVPGKIVAHGLHVKASGTTNVKKGHKVTLKISGATKNAGYYCLEASGIPGSKTKVAAFVGSLTTPTSSAKGTFTCAVAYVPFTAATVDKKGKASCPPTAAEKKKGYSCLVTVADVATKGKKHTAVVTFTTKK